MSIQSGKFVLPPSEDTALSGDLRFGGGAYRANLYVYDPFGRIDWYALVPASFQGGRFFTFGRGPDCNISLNDGAVSTRHAYIAAEGGQLVLRDLQSTNGSFCNGERIRERVLQHGDVVRLGATDVRFLYSYRDSPVHLVLEFTQGRNAGRTLATTRASTQIGRLNCAINLQGAEIAAQHVRLDAFGAELLFVVTLQRQLPTWLNDQLISGIVPARVGDRLRLGDHELVLRVARPEELVSAEPLGDGTLLLKERTQSGPGGDPVLQLAAEDLPHHVPTLTDEAALADGERFLSPTRPPEGLLPASPAEPDGDDPGDGPEERWRARQGPRRLRTARRALLLGLLLGAVVGGAALYELPRSVQIRGRVVPHTQAPLLATVRGRVEQLAVEVGAVVRAGDVVARLVDLDAQAEVERLALEITELERETKGSRVVKPGLVPEGLRQGLRSAEEALDEARRRRKAVLTAFNRRELGLAALEEARAAEVNAERAVERLRGSMDAHRARQQVFDPGPEPALLDRIAELVARKERLADSVRVVVSASEAGLLISAREPPLQVGRVVVAGEPLFLVVPLDPLAVQLELDEARLDAVSARTLVTVVPWDQPGAQAYEARIQAPVPTAEGGYQVRGLIANPGGELRPGQRVSAEIELPPSSALSLAREWLAGRPL